MDHIITYLCPLCENNIEREVNYPPYSLWAKPKESNMTISHWCNKCGAINEYCISINPLRKGGFRIKTEYFKCNSEKINIKLKLKKEK
jgi:hypothetical protein